MAINERLIDTKADSSGVVDEANLTLELDAGDVDSYDGTGDVWYDIHNFEFTPTTNVAENFNTVLYDGQETPLSVTGVGFTPDFVWIKNRTLTFVPVIYDSVRGTGNTKAIYSSETSAQGSNPDNQNLSSFDLDGFTLGDTQNGGTNIIRTDLPSSNDYVAWCFKAGGASVTNTNGDLQSQVSANNDLGFSIATYTGNNTANQTVGNGLDSPVELLIVKRTDTTGNWVVWNRDATSGNGKYFYLDLTNGISGPAGTGVWDSSNTTTMPTSGLFNVNTNALVNAGSGTYVAYSFISKRGISDVGSYVGDGSTSNFIFTGFEPAFIIIKRSDSTSNWRIFDNVRGTEKELYANNSDAEPADVAYIDFNRNGFTLTNSGSWINGNTNEYIYYAVAANTNETGLTPDTAGFTQGTTKSPTVLNLQGAGYTGSGDWLDSSGSSNNGVITGATYVNQGNASYFSFDGSNDLVTLGPSQNSATKAIEVWLNPHTFSSDDWVFGQGDGQASENYIRVFSSGVQVRMGNRTLTHNYTTANKWIHVVGTHKTVGNGFEFYFNGVKVDETTDALAAVPNDYFQLGARYNGGLGGYFDGEIGQVRVYNTTLSSADIQANYEATKQYLLPYLELNLEAGNNSSYPGTGTTWFDLTSNDNDGTITGATWQQEVGNFFEFDGSSDYVTVPATSTTPIDVRQSFSVETWVKFNVINATHNFIENYSNGGTISFTLGVLSTGIVNVTLRSGSSNTNVSTTETITAGSFTHIAVTRTVGTDVKIYIDGELVKTQAYTSTPNISSSNVFTIGGKQWAFDGEIGQVRMYSTALSQAQVRQNFNFTSSLYPNYFPGTLGAGAAKPAWNAGGYFQFDGSNDFVQTNLPIRSTDVSTSLWFKADPGGLGTTNPPLFFTSNGGRIDILITGSTSNSVTAVADSLQIEVTTATTEFNHLAIVFEGFAPSYTGSYTTSITFTVYINGNAITSSGTLTPYAQTANGLEPNLRVGRSGGGFYFDGQISKVKAYTNALTPEEINILFSEGF